MNADYLVHWLQKASPKDLENVIWSLLHCVNRNTPLYKAVDAYWAYKMFQHSLKTLGDIRGRATIGGFSNQGEIVQLINDSGLLKYRDEKYPWNVTPPAFEPDKEKPVPVTREDLQGWSIGGGLPMGLILLNASKRGIELFDRYIVGDMDVVYEPMWGMDRQPFDPWQECSSKRIVVTNSPTCPRNTPLTTTYKAMMILSVVDLDGVLTIKVFKQQGDAPALMTIPLSEQED